MTETLCKLAARKLDAETGIADDGRLADLARDMSRKAYDIRQPQGLDVDVTAETVDGLADRGTAVLELVGSDAP